MNPSDEPSITHSQLSCSIQFLVETSNYIDAVRLYESHDIPAHPEVLLAISRAYFHLEKYATALNIIHEAERRNWAIDDFVFLKGEVLFSLKEYETALEQFEKSNKMKPSSISLEAIARCKIMIELESKKAK